MHLLGSNQHTKKPKRDADVNSSLDQNGEKEMKDAESVQATQENEKRSRNGHKSPQKKAQKRRRARSRTIEESDTSGSDFEEDENLKAGAHGTSRHKVGVAVPQSDDLPLSFKNETRPVRMTRSQAIGIHVLEKTTVVETDLEEGQDDESSIPAHKNVSKRLKLAKQLNAVASDATGDADGHLSSIEEEDKRPQTQIRKAVEV